jgi:Tol biopolymer transport system component
MLPKTRRWASAMPLIALALCPSRPCLAQEKLPGSPEDHLPPNIAQLTGFGERAAWSPDGTKIAFMSRSFGDAFEIDLKTRLTRLLTGHFRHAGSLRIQYLPNGDFLLIGARSFTDIRTTRARDQEFWIMKANLKGPPVPLGQKVSEGVAISPRRMRISWALRHEADPEHLARGESAMYVADIVEDGGRPALANTKEVLRAKGPECVLEPQDFRDDDAEIIYTCYREPYADVMGLDLKAGKVTTYRKVEREYNEVEGISPLGQWILVESSRGKGPEQQNGGFVDIWKLRLEPNSNDFVRLTRWGDYEGYKASNPVVSPDGKRVAFQSARSNEPAGVGHGLFLLELAEGSR